MGTILGARLAILIEPGYTTRPHSRGAAVQRDLVERARGGDHDACIDEARRLRRHRVDVELTDISGALPSIPGYESAIADRDQLECGFIRLTPEMRAVIVLHHYLDLPLPAVAATLGIPLGTAKSRLHRALGLLRAAIDADARIQPDLAEGRPS